MDDCTDERCRHTCASTSPSTSTSSIRSFPDAGVSADQRLQREDDAHGPTQTSSILPQLDDALTLPGEGVELRREETARRRGSAAGKTGR